MAKIMIWAPAPWYCRSYPKTALAIARGLRVAGHEVAWFALTGLGWGEIPYDGMRVFPNNAQDYGETWLPIWNAYYGPDLILQHFDCWVIPDASRRFTRLPVVWMPPVDHQPLPPPLKESLTDAKQIVAITRFAEQSFRDAAMDSTYIPHGFDSSIYFPGDRAEARRRMEFRNDCFLLGVVGTNKGPRKNLGNVLKAFRDFLDEVPEAREDALIFFHTYARRDASNPQGYDLWTMWNDLGIAKWVKYTQATFYSAIGFTEEEMADLYRSLNWLVSVPLGEGFNLPAIECLACGTPVIFSNFSATPEVVGPGGLSVEPAEYIPFELSSAWQAIPSTRQITERMVEAYLDWKAGGEMARDLGEKGRVHVLGNYAWDVVIPQWQSYLQWRADIKRRNGIQLGMKADLLKRERLSRRERPNA